LKGLRKVSIGGKRYYICGSQRLPSVTTILKYGLPKPVELELWELFTEDAELIRDYRALVGVISHYRLASAMAAKFGLPVPELEIRNASLLDGNAIEIVKQIWRRVKYWIELYNPIPYLVEHTVVNKELGYAGTCDLVVKLDKYFFLVDFKTSKACYPVFNAQIAAYLKAIRAPLNGAILRVNEDSAEFKILSEKEIEEGFDLFLQAKRNFERNKF
jgi:hypothetical protein